MLFLTYIELLDDDAFCHECNALVRREISDSAESTATPKKRNAIATAKDMREDSNVDYPTWHRMFRAAYAAGFLLKVKVEGWKVFCARLNVAPIALWEQAEFPGLDRLKRALALANAGVAFPSAAEMACWVNEVRPAERLEQTEADVLTSERFVASLYSTFR